MLRSSFFVFLAVAALGISVADAQQPAPQPMPAWRRPRLVGRASDSGRFALDEAKLRAMFPDFPWNPDHLAYLNEHLDRGDSRAAIVASTKPLVVSAWSDELDAVILINFQDALIDQYGLAVGDQLVASWIYPHLPQPAADIVPGPHQLAHHYNDGCPIVADFFSSSADKIKQRKLGISKKEWDRVRELTPAAMTRAAGQYRSCFPLATDQPAAVPPAPTATNP